MVEFDSFFFSFDVGLLRLLSNLVFFFFLEGEWKINTGLCMCAEARPALLLEN